ncbi:carboxylesterase/lipase family protein [Pseudoduganella chitinolytica]|uniref:Carboxylic ester hydrolase n=1 Tax=Pseudoduganella chitinolytica TaxID=34070 RepID=A0ABY8B578_9BURK|nr:carboxylesterase family protein [Pseudoduganella chitinolytica]WEF30896.1 carboxylesterase family protein [Pseudoduganella chitinolytica]
MMTRLLTAGVLGALCAATATAAASLAAPTVVTVEGGAIEGAYAEGVRTFKGVPFAAPPVGPLRWKTPQPVQPWNGVRPAKDFGARPMQLALFSDMVFRSPRIDEDCLYLNVWTPPVMDGKKLPVLVYFHGGGLAAGDGSEPRYDGAAMARQGIVALTVNYRLGVFGFLAHPELSAEGPTRASGNYGLMDQAAALRWVQRNIAAFGGDPAQVTIAGESAGSYSVSAQMINPQARGLFARAIGESGSVLGMKTPTLAEAEQQGMAFATAAGAASLAELRALPAAQLLEAAGRPGTPWFSIVADGVVIDRPPIESYRRRLHAKVPLLAGWNSQEMHAGALLGQAPATKESFAAVLEKLYGEQAREAARAYDYDVQEAARDLASDRWIVYGTWKWMDLHRTHAPTYRYYFTRPRPGADGGAVHSGEIEYALGNLDGNKVYRWTDEDRRASATMQAYFANFIRTGNPNGAGLPHWPTVDHPAPNVMRIDVTSGAFNPRDRERFEFQDSQHHE